MAGHVPSIHVFLSFGSNGIPRHTEYKGDLLMIPDVAMLQDVDARDKPGHDGT
jgi:hypothetical protein